MFLKVWDAKVAKKLKCKAFIPINPRNTQKNKALSNKGIHLCLAGLEMKSVGSWNEGLRKHLKFRCPIKTDKKFAISFPNGCPIGHQRFFQGNAYGCTKSLDITDDPRSQVPRNSNLFKNTFKLRTEVERYFARLGNRDAEQTTHYKINHVKNQFAVVHLALSLVAYASSVFLNRKDKIRCYSSFADNWIPVKISLAA